MLREFARRILSIAVQAAVLLGLPLAAAGRGLARHFRIERISYWTGTPILTLAQKAASERLLGQRTLVIVRFTYFITQDFDVVLSHYCSRVPWLLYPLSGAACLLMLATASRVHTFADGGILPSARPRRVATVELLAYRLFGIPHLVWTYGADVRTREKTLDLGSINCCTECTQVGKACICDSTQGQKNLARLKANGSIVFSMGDMIEYTEGSRNDLYFWPLDLLGTHATSPPVQPRSRPGSVRIVHAANHREFKGTEHLQSAVSSLQEEGVPIELVLVENLPNEKALGIYRTADVIFDQCLIGFHGYFALEAMALGKPVMCYVRKPAEYLLHAEECPIINTHIDTLKEDLRRLVNTRDTLPFVGMKGRTYVERYYSREAFASRLKNTYIDLGIFR